MLIDHQSNPVEEAIVLPEIELPHQDDVGKAQTSGDSSDSDTAVSAKKRPRIDEKSTVAINPLKLIRRLVPGTNQETYTVQEKEQQEQQQKKQEPQQNTTVIILSELISVEFQSYYLPLFLG